MKTIKQTYSLGPESVRHICPSVSTRTFGSGSSHGDPPPGRLSSAVLNAVLEAGLQSIERILSPCGLVPLRAPCKMAGRDGSWKYYLWIVTVMCRYALPAAKSLESVVWNSQNSK